MNDRASETTMIRYECCQCDMTATCVATEEAAVAWGDHMLTHVDAWAYRSWVWTIVPLWP